MADNTNRLAGTASLNVNGKPVLLKGNFAWKPDGATRESLTGLDGYHGYKEQRMPGEIRATLRDWNGISVTDLAELTNIPIVVTLANGKTVAGRGMTPTEQPSATADDAEIEIVWQGPSVREV